MRTIILSLFLFFFAGCIGKTQTQWELEAKNNNEKIAEWEKKQNLSPVEKKMPWYMVREIREYKKQVKEGKTLYEAVAAIKKSFGLDDKDRIYIKVRIYREKEGNKEHVRSFIEAIERVAELEAVAGIVEVGKSAHNN